MVTPRKRGGAAPKYQPRATRTRTPKQVERYQDSDAQALAQGVGETSGSSKGAGGRVDIPQGHGVPLRSIPAFEKFIAKKDTSSDMLHALHRVLYGRPGSKNKFKQNLRAFSGFPQDALAEIDPAEWYHTTEEPSELVQAVLASPEYLTLHARLEKLTVSNLSNLMHIFGLSSINTKESRVRTLARFFMKPTTITKSGKAKTPRKKFAVTSTPRQAELKSTTTPSRKRKLDGAGPKGTVESEEELQNTQSQVASPAVSSPEKPAIAEKEQNAPSPLPVPSHVEEKAEHKEESPAPPTENFPQKEAVTVEELSRGDTTGETLTYHGMDESPLVIPSVEATVTESFLSPTVESPASTAKEHDQSPPSKRAKVNQKISDVGGVTDNLADFTSPPNAQEMDVDVTTGDTVPQEPIISSSVEYTETRQEDIVTEDLTLPSFEEQAEPHPVETTAEEAAVPPFTQSEETHPQQTTTEGITPFSFEQPTEAYQEDTVTTMESFTPEPLSTKAYDSLPVNDTFFVADSAPSSQPAKTSSIGVNEPIITTPSVPSSVAEKKDSEELTSTLATYSSTSSSNTVNDRSSTPSKNPLSVPFGVP
ncbi:hypothetical protein IWQ61_009672, partial [Dispira simplex]